MIRFQLSYLGHSVEVSIASTDPNQYASILIEPGIPLIAGAGDPEDFMLDEIRENLSNSYGAYGHFIGYACTPIDLNSAMFSPQMQGYSPELIEGEEIIGEVYSPGIPEDAIT